MRNQKLILFCCLTLLVFAAFNVQAHGVRVFAWSEGDKIRVETAFRGGNPARQAEITVRDEKSGDKLISGLTDDLGVFRFSIPDRARQEGMDLKITADCGPGHKGHWLLKAEEYLDVPAPAASEPEKSEQKQEGKAGGDKEDVRASGINEQALRRIISEELDKKLAPVKKRLHENQRQVDIKDIIGGIGWLLGLAGIAAWFRSKRFASGKKEKE
ncbi:MAG: hypothetical protein ACLFV2_05725 [Desulfurivibrionaceae bacterium]